MRVKTFKKTEQKTPKVEMYLPLAFWSKIMMTLDRKVHSLADAHGFGSVSLQIMVRDGVVRDVVLNDEIRIREERQIPGTEKDLTDK